MTFASSPAYPAAPRSQAVPRPRDSDRLSPALIQAFAPPLLPDLEFERLISLIDRHDAQH